LGTGKLEAIRHERFRHPELENKQGNEREDAKSEEGAERKVSKVASSQGASTIYQRRDSIISTLALRLKVKSLAK